MLSKLNRIVLQSINDTVKMAAIGAQVIGYIERMPPTGCELNDKWIFHPFIVSTVPNPTKWEIESQFPKIETLFNSEIDAVHGLFNWHFSEGVEVDDIGDKFLNIEMGVIQE